jgi:hypothetical protein
MAIAALGLLLPAIIACSGGDQAETAPEPSAHEAVAAPMPDTTTFFPLIEGSYWVYDEVFEGEIQEDGELRREVVRLTPTDSGYEATVLETYRDGLSDTLYYRCDSEGRVWRKGAADTGFTVFADLYPRARAEVGEFTYYPCLSDSSTCLLLQNYVYDEASYEEQLEWRSYVFVKGVGLTSFGGAELGMELREHRIGKK